MKVPRTTQKKESGISLLETLIAVMLLMIMGAGMTAVFGFCMGSNKNQGELATRTTEYAQDKMEQLMALTFTDGTTNTTVFPPTAVGGTGLGGAMAANTTVGGTTQGAAVAQYVDYLDVNGNLLGGAAGAFYTRQWSITASANAKLKTINVAVYAANTAGGAGAAASSVISCAKTNNQ